MPGLVRVGRRWIRGLAVLGCASMLASCVPNEPPLQPPVVSGTPAVAATLTAVGGTWAFTPAVLSYRWESCATAHSGCVAVGEDASTYTARDSDAGHHLRVTITANGGQQSAVATSATVGPVKPSPILGAIDINDGAPDTRSLSVTLHTIAFGSHLPDHVRVANGADPTSAPWQPFQRQIPWMLGNSNGASATVSIQFQEAGVLSPVISDSIRYAPVGPMITSVTDDVRFNDVSGSAIEIDTVDVTSATITARDGGTGTPRSHAMSAGPSGRFSWAIPVGQPSFEFTIQVGNASPATTTAPDLGAYSATRVVDMNSDAVSLTVTTESIDSSGATTTSTSSGEADPSTGEFVVRMSGPNGTFVGSMSADGSAVLHDIDRHVYVDLGSAEPADLGVFPSGPAQFASVVSRPGTSAFSVSGTVTPPTLLPADLRHPVPLQGIVTYRRSGQFSDATTTTGTPGTPGYQSSHSRLTPTGAAPQLDLAPAGVPVLTASEYQRLLANELATASGGISSRPRAAASAVSPACAELAALIAETRWKLLGHGVLGLVVEIYGPALIGRLGQISSSWIGVGAGLVVVGVVAVILQQMLDDMQREYELACKDDPPPPPDPGGGSGDPHMRSFDGLRFDLQLEGEFILTRSDGGDFDVQIGTRLLQSGAAVTDEIAIRAGADTIVLIGRDPTGGFATATLDGEPTVTGTTYALAGGGTYRDGVVTLADGTTTTVTPLTSGCCGDFLNYDIQLAPTRLGQVVGLLGTADGDSSNDLRSRDGLVTVDPAAVGSLNGDAFNTGYAASWVPPENERLLPGAARPFSSPTDTISLATVPTDQLAAAMSTCQALGWTTANGLDNCVYDVALTGDAGFADVRGQIANFDQMDAASNAPDLSVPGIHLISTASDRTQADNGVPYAPALSGNGRYVAFESAASNLVAGDTNGISDVFVKDTVTGSTTRVSVASNGTQANLGSRTPALSFDGRHVAFVSDATNLVPGDTNGFDDVFVRDMATGQTDRVSVATGGAQSDGPATFQFTTDTLSVSDDGRYVAFQSVASNLVPGDTNGTWDVFVRDRTSGQTERNSVSGAGTEGDGASVDATLSRDGRFLAFRSRASNLVIADTNGLDDVFVRDRIEDTIKRVSIATGGEQSNGEAVAAPSISDDGRFVAFTSNGSNLVAGDANGSLDVFVRDRSSNVTEAVSVTGGGQPAGVLGNGPAISGDGRYVAFASDASELTPNHIGGFWDSFRYDRAEHVMIAVSAPADTSTAWSAGLGYGVAMSASGARVGFSAQFGNLVPDDVNVWDVFLWRSSLSG